MFLILITTLVAALLGAVVGGVLGWLGAALFAHVTKMSSFEGGRGYFIGYLTLLATLIGMIAATAIAVGLRQVAGFTAAMLHVGAAMLGIAALAALAFLVYWLRKPIPDWVLDLPLHFELRAPLGKAWPELGPPALTLHTDRYERACDLNIPDAGAQALLTGSTLLGLPSLAQVLVLRLPGSPVQRFRITLPRNPKLRRATRWSEWQASESRDPAALAPDAQACSCRYRLLPEAT